ncbi:hypothetical protein IMZ48_18475 [Candidatus Bathyarchaeota archaeon]|nr:hypothetical protein [Candidatus Bathyarchaeota archaeon]
MGRTRFVMLWERGVVAPTSARMFPILSRISSISTSSAYSAKSAPLSRKAGGVFTSWTSFDAASSGSSAPMMALTSATPSSECRASDPGTSAADW